MAGLASIIHEHMFYVKGILGKIGIMFGKRIVRALPKAPMMLARSLDFAA